MSFHCIVPTCGGVTRVKDSREFEDGGGIRRLRECARCGQRFETEERASSTPRQKLGHGGYRWNGKTRRAT